MKDIREYMDIVMSYYRDIDIGNLDAVFSIFSSEAIYDRGLSFKLSGIKEIKKFYNETRSLRGEHLITKCEGTNQTVKISGSFLGHQNNTPIQLSFNDHWSFNDNKKIVYRQSTLSIEGI